MITVRDGNTDSPIMIPVGFRSLVNTQLGSEGLQMPQESRPREFAR